MKIHCKSVHYIDRIVILYFFHVVHIMRGPKSSLFHVVFPPRWFLPKRVTPMVQNPGDMLLVFTFEIHQSCEYSERFRDSLMTVYYFHITIFFVGGMQFPIIITSVDFSPARHNFHWCFATHKKGLTWGGKTIWRTDIKFFATFNCLF